MLKRKSNRLHHGGKNIMDSITGVWEAIIALAGGMFVMAPYVYTRASRKELKESEEKMATKLQLREFKEDVMRYFDDRWGSLSQRMDDRFDAVIELIKAKHANDSHGSGRKRR